MHLIYPLYGGIVSSAVISVAIVVFLNVDPPLNYSIYDYYNVFVYYLYASSNIFFVNFSEYLNAKNYNY